MNKKILLVVLVIGIILGLVIGLFFRIYTPFIVWGGSRINLQKLGEPIGGEFKGGVWRIFGETSGVESEIHFLKFNQEVVQSVGFEYLDDVYSDLTDVGISAIASDIEIKIWQEEPPYWQIPWVKVDEDVMVCPEMYGVQREYNALGYWYTIISEVKTEPLIVDVYQLDFDHASLVVPLTMYATKYAGETAPVTLVCDELEHYYDETRNVYNVPLSEWTFAELQENTTQQKEFIFENPNNSEEFLKISLIFSFGAVEAEQYPYGKDNIFAIVPKDETMPLSKHFIFRTGNSYSESALRNLLIGWQGGIYEPFSYYYYWFGDLTGYEQSQFKGNTIHYESGPYWDPGFLCDYGKFVMYNDYHIPANEYWYGSELHNALTAEGYATSRTEYFPVFDFPGWYTPSKETNNWMNKRYPFQPYYDITTTEGKEWESNETHKFTRPSGLSLVDYIASPNVRVPLEATQTVDYPQNYSSNYEMRPKPYVDRVEVLNTFTNNDWADGIVPLEPWKFFLPLDARHWMYVVDISTELADTYVVTETYLDVQIENPEVSDTDLDFQETCTVTMNLKNTLDLEGSVWLLADVTGGSIGVKGGLGRISFDSSEIKYNYTVTLVHATYIEEDTTIQVVLYVWNGEKRTGEYSFELLLRKSFAVSDTKIKIVALTIDNKPIQGITGKVIFGEKVKYSQMYTNEEGELIIDLNEQYRGEATVVVWDIDDRYYSVNKTKYVEPEQPNVYTFHLIAKGKEPPFDWEKYLPYIIGGTVAVLGLAGGIYIYKRRQVGVRY